MNSSSSDDEEDVASYPDSDPEYEPTITTAIISRLHHLEDAISKIKDLKYYLIYTRGIIIGPKPKLDRY